MIRSAVSISGKKGVTGTIATNVGDLRLRAVVGDAVVSSGPTIDVSDLAFSLEKPGSFIVDYDVPTRDLRFQFMNMMNVMGKQVNWTYTHRKRENKTVLDGTLVLDQSNRVSGSYELGSWRKRKVNYSYLYKGIATLEPGYDFGKNSWELGVSYRFDGDLIKASYETRSKNLDVDWLWRSSLSKEGRVKVSASFNLAEGLQMPKLSAETSWNFEM